ncbi:uncharacterized protein DUF1071 [Aneurinibacillus soli]|uniref:SSAP RNA binding domain-containing protein n=1 Tax=Aneurinibacillus soli TaxID=1500254 RepID=A0A0U5B7L1_9BACL|nr:uncharacterized protein DUF1071 [Aneurinibacillus soli]BAU27606.1 hypothetical protein CB4_01780 [Aneurinibacillus soli]
MEQVATNYFAELAKIDVSAHTEKKGKFTYLSWAWAVDVLRKHDPTATWEVIRFNGVPFMSTDCGYFVEVAVTCHGITLSQIHPVLDNSNKPIAKPNTFQINTSIQRCLVKAIALHGLGLYIYAGEDLPDGETTKETPQESVLKPTPAIRAKWETGGGNPDALESWFANCIKDGKSIEEIDQFLTEKIKEMNGNTNSSQGKPATDNQRKAIFATAKDKGLDNDGIKRLVEYLTKKQSTTELTSKEASDVIKLLKETPQEDIHAMISPPIDISDDDLPF